MTQPFQTTRRCALTTLALLGLSVSLPLQEDRLGLRGRGALAVVLRVDLRGHRADGAVAGHASAMRWGRSSIC